jgi:hypothetical protein
MKSKTFLTDLLIASAIFLVTFLTFWLSPVHQVTDSNYSMLVSDCVMREQTFALDACGMPVLTPIPLANYFTNGGMYQVEVERGRVYYFFPVGSSVLSIPYVAVARLFGVSPRNPDGTFNVRGESAIQLGLAAMLMALLTSLFFVMSRMLLPIGWSLLIALGGGLGTQVWSTASRGLWSHTWSALLAGIVVYLLMAAETSRRRLSPVLLATVLSWMYFVRPTNSVVILGVSVYVLLFYRRLIIPFLVTGAAWLGLFFYYSWHNFGRLFPKYYEPGRLLFANFLIALRGNLISPSRGVLVFVPVLWFVALVLIVYWRYRPMPRLTWLALYVVVSTILIISGFSHWWGGASFGPRFSTDAVPWFVLLAIIGIRAGLNRRQQEVVSSAGWTTQLVFGGLLLAAGIFINARGATALATWRWNPGDAIQVNAKLWDWRQPQFLAGLVQEPMAHGYEQIPLGVRIDFSKAEQSTKYLWYGWSGGEENFRWTEGHEAALMFSLAEQSNLVLKMKVLPFISQGVPQQRILVELNGQPIDSISLNQNTESELSIKLAANLLRHENILSFNLPDAASPELLGVSSDQRMLGMAVHWIELGPDLERGKPRDQR